MDRRDFLKGSLAGAGAVAGLSAGGLRAMAEDAAKPDEKPKPGVLKLCSQEGKIPGKSLKEKAENILKYGGCGIEFGGLSVDRAKQIKKELEGTGVGIAALCCGYYPLIDPDEEKRKKGAEDLKRALEGAGEAGSTGVIFVPAFNNHPQLPWFEGRKVLIDMLGPVGEHAKKLGTRVLMEPLNRGEARFLNLLAQASSICRDVKSDGIGLMGDFYHMYIEETSDEGAFLSGGKYAHHVHLASRIRVLPGQDHLREPNKEERSFVSGFRGLKRIGYQDYCSLECGTIGKDAEEIPKSFEFLKKQWDEAVV
jgi:sugar phosphate isomerase/epimerase